MIYKPREDSELLKKYVKKYAFGRALDMGAGSGIQAVEAGKSRKVNSVLAVDIDEIVVKSLKSKIKGIVIKKSDLFSNVKEKFNTIIFNPPYLPEDKRIEDKALYGGRKGHEVLERFLNVVNDYLSAKGIVLIVFSSLTNKEKINQIIERNLLEFEELERKHFFFEDLFVYKITKSDVLKKLEKKGVSGVGYLAHGKRGNVFIGKYRNKKIAVKIKRKESLAVERMKNEVKWLKVLNKKKIGPKLLFYGEDYLVYGFVDGEFILDWIRKNRKKEIKRVLVSVLKQCFEMDRLMVNKEEMHRPIKHILINKKGNVILLDFERCYKTKKPHNVTQFGVFLMRNRLVNEEKMKGLLKDYKREMKKNNFDKVVELINGKI
jgi:release factor glutamine methyltransferase